VLTVAEPSTGGLREEKLVFGEVTIVIRVTAEDSGGAMTVLEEVPPMVDTPLHVHSHEDELSYVVEGEHIVQRGAEEFRLGPGDAIFCPRGVPHAQRRVEPGVGRELIVLTPGGFEQFFRDLAGRAQRNARPRRIRRRLRESRHHLAVRPPPAQPSAGGMLWLRRKRFSGS
jgi:quercetin dioxygenase-like cupin family protein